MQRVCWKAPRGGLKADSVPLDPPADHVDSENQWSMRILFSVHVRFGGGELSSWPVFTLEDSWATLRISWMIW